MITRSADLYSLGVIILEILTGHKGHERIEDVRTRYVIVRKMTDQFPFWLRRVDFQIIVTLPQCILSLSYSFRYCVISFMAAHLVVVQ